MIFLEAFAFAHASGSLDSGIASTDLIIIGLEFQGVLHAVCVCVCVRVCETSEMKFVWSKM